jgi:hypothetical protein
LFSFGLMNAWFRRLLLILTIGGGFMGVAVTTQFFSEASKVIAYIACWLLSPFMVMASSPV